MLIKMLINAFTMWKNIKISTNLPNKPTQQTVKNYKSIKIYLTTKKNIKFYKSKKTKSTIIKQFEN